MCRLTVALSGHRPELRVAHPGPGLAHSTGCPLLPGTLRLGPPGDTKAPLTQRPPLPTAGRQMLGAQGGSSGRGVSEPRSQGESRQRPGRRVPRGSPISPSGPGAGGAAGLRPGDSPARSLPRMVFCEGGRPARCGPGPGTGLWVVAAVGFTGWSLVSRGLPSVPREHTASPCGLVPTTRGRVARGPASCARSVMVPVGFNSAGLVVTGLCISEASFPGLCLLDLPLQTVLLPVGQRSCQPEGQTEPTHPGQGLLGLVPVEASHGRGVWWPWPWSQGWCWIWAHQQGLVGGSAHPLFNPGAELSKATHLCPELSEVVAGQRLQAVPIRVSPAGRPPAPGPADERRQKWFSPGSS